MDAEEAIETGGLAAFFLFTALFLSTIDFSLGGSPNTVETANKLSRFLYAGVMTVAPTPTQRGRVWFGYTLDIGLLRG